MQKELPMNVEAGPRGSDIVAALKQAGIEHVAALPDITTSAGLLWPLSEDRELHLIRLCKEDEGVSICAGLAFCEKRSVLLMQQTGFFDSKLLRYLLFFLYLSDQSLHFLEVFHLMRQF